MHILSVINSPPAQVVGAPIPPWALVYPVTSLSFKLAVMQYVRDPLSAQPVGTCVLPCTNAQYGTVSANIISLCYHPWFMFLNAIAPICPIGELYVPRPRSNTVDRFSSQPPAFGLPLWV